MAESEQQSEQGEDSEHGGGGTELRSSGHSGAEHHGKEDYEQSGIMRDWVLVAAGMERMFFLLYALIFAVITSVYI